jgi:hypothetical protein
LRQNTALIKDKVINTCKVSEIVLIINLSEIGVKIYKLNARIESESNIAAPLFLNIPYRHTEIHIYKNLTGSCLWNVVMTAEKIIRE